MTATVRSTDSTARPPAASADDYLLTAAEAAGLLKVSRRQLDRLNVSDGIGPRPVRIGRSVRWQRAELTAWVTAGCPDRSEWDARRASAIRTSRRTAKRTTNRTANRK